MRESVYHLDRLRTDYLDMLLPHRRDALVEPEEVRRLESRPAQLLESVYHRNQRWVVRALHRNEHLDEVDAALGATGHQAEH